MNSSREKIHKFNAGLVRSALRKVSQADLERICEETALSGAECLDILRLLEERGEVIREGSEGDLFRYNSGHSLLAVVYVSREKGEERLFHSVLNSSGEILKEEGRAIADLKSDDLINLAGELAGEYPPLKVLSFGIPGVVHRGMIDQCEFASLSRFDLKGVISRRYGLKVSVENDVNCAALGHWSGAEGIPPESLVYMYYPEEGISGSGIVVNGRILRGASDFAGEISYLPLGIALEKQGRIQKNTGRFAELLAKTVHSVNCVINPRFFVISARWFTDSFRRDLLEKIEKTSPENQIPRIIFEPEMHGSYVKGLVRMGMGLLE